MAAALIENVFTYNNGGHGGARAQFDLANSRHDGDVLTASHAVDAATGLNNITLSWEEPVKYPLVYDSLQHNSLVLADNQALIAYVNNVAHIPAPDVCYRISELAKAEKNMMKNIEERANTFRLGRDVELAPGTHFPDYPEMGENNVALPEQNYWTDFFAHDAIAYNHNGFVNLSTVNAMGVLIPVPPLAGPGGPPVLGVRQNITGFQAYASDPSAPIRNDALRYYLKPGGREPYAKYAMPEIKFKLDAAGNVVLGPAEPQGGAPVHITTQPFGQNPTVQAGNDGVLPKLNGEDYNNLEQVIEDYKVSVDPAKNVMVDGPPRRFETVRATIKVRSYDDVRFMYSFPN
jgi:hypothetical protein